MIISTVELLSAKRPAVLLASFCIYTVYTVITVCQWDFRKSFPFQRTEPPITHRLFTISDHFCIFLFKKRKILITPRYGLLEALYAMMIFRIFMTFILDIVIRLLPASPAAGLRVPYMFPAF